MLGRILVFIGGLLVVVLFMALLVPFFIDWTDFRRDFEDQASRILGRKVVVHGAVQARLLPFPSVTLHDVRAGEDRDGSPLIQVARFSMDAELAPFLSGEARIFDMRIEEPKAKIRLLPDGTLDWSRGARGSLPAKTVVLEGVSVKGGQIEFIDEQSGRNRIVTGIDADLSAGSLAGPWRAEGRAAIDGHAGAFNLSTGSMLAGDPGLRMRLRVIPDEQPVNIELEGTVASQEGRPVYKGDFSLQLRPEKKEEQQAADAKNPGPRSRGSFELTNGRIRIPAYRVELGDTENPYTVTGEATLDTGNEPQFLLTAQGQQIDINRLAAEAIHSGKGARVGTTSVRQRVEALSNIVARIPVPQVPGRASITLPALVAGDTTIRDIRLDVRPAGTGWTVVNAVALLPGKTQLEASGQLSLVGGASFNGDLVVASNQPSGLANWLSGTVDPAIRQLDSAGFSARVSLTQRLQRFEKLELAVGGASLRGRLERQSESGASPSLSVDLGGNEINLDSLRALASLMTGEEAGATILDHRIAARMKADRFTAFGVTALDTETAFTLNGGVLALEKLTAGDVAGARIGASGRVEGSLLQYAGKGSLKFQAADPGPFLVMLRDRLPKHPLLDRFVESAHWYAGADMALDMTLDSKEKGLNVSLSGTANGSRLSAVARLPDLLALTDDTDISLDAVVKNQSTAVLFGQAGLDPLPLDADGPGVLSLKLDGDSLKPVNAEINFSTDRTRFSGRGSIRLGPDDFGSGRADLSLESADIEPYLIMNGIGLPQLGGGAPVGLKGVVEISREAVRLASINGQVAGNSISGNLASARAAPYKATGELSLGTVDLAWLAEAVYGPVTEAADGSISTAAVSLPVFPNLDAEVVLKAGEFHPGISGPIKGFSTRLQHASNTLTLGDIAGNWLGGKLAGELSMANGEGTATLRGRLRLEQGDLAPLAYDFGGKPVATGRFDVDVTTEAVGKSMREMLAAAGGSGEVRFRDLVVNGIDTGLLGPVMGAADGIKGDVTVEKVAPLLAGFPGKGEIRAGNIAAPFTISGGAVHIPSVAIDAPPARLAASADIDLGAMVLDAQLRVAFDAGLEALPGTEPAVRLLWKGPVAAPSRSLDVEPLASFLSVRAFERERRRVEALQAGILEKQRLRREAALYRFIDAGRKAAEERARAEKARLEEEARLKAIAEEEARAAAQRELERKQVEEAEKKAAAERAAEAARLLQEQKNATPPLQLDMDTIIRGELPPPAPANGG